MDDGSKFKTARQKVTRIGPVFDRADLAGARRSGQAALTEQAARALEQLIAALDEVQGQALHFMLYRDL